MPRRPPDPTGLARSSRSARASGRPLAQPAHLRCAIPAFLIHPKYKTRASTCRRSGDVEACACSIKLALFFEDLFPILDQQIERLFGGSLVSHHIVMDAF